MKDERWLLIAEWRSAYPAIAAVCFGIPGFPASRCSTSFTARRAAAIASELLDSGPCESVLAKKTRSIGCRTRGCTSVYNFGVDMYMG